MIDSSALNGQVYGIVGPTVGNCATSYTFASTGNSQAALTIPTPQSPVGATIEGNLLIASIDFTIPNFTITPPTGWILIQSTVIDNPGNNKDLSKVTYYKVATSSEPASYTWNFGNPTKASGGIICIETGASTYSVISKNDYPTSAVNITSSGVVTVAPNTLVFAFFTSASGKDVISPPATWTTMYNTNTGGASGSTSLAVSKAFAAVGNTGAFTATSIELVPRSVHTIGVLCRPRERASASILAKASSSLTNARVNNVLQPGIVASSTAGSQLNALVNNVGTHTATSYALSSLVPLLYKEVPSGVLASCTSNSTLNALVNNIGSHSATATASASLTSEVYNNAEASVASFAEAELLYTQVNKLVPPGTIAFADSTSLAISSLTGEASSQTVGVANSDLSSFVNNVSSANLSASAITNLPSTEVNKVLPPGSLALSDSTTLFVPLLVGESESQVIAYANADSGSLVINEATSDISAASYSSLTAHVDNPFPSAEIIIESTAELTTAVIKNIEDSILCTATSSPLVSSVNRVSFPTSVICTAFARLSTPQPVKPKTTTTAAVSTPRVEVYPMIRII